MRTTDTVAGAGLTIVSVATAVMTHKKEGAIEEDRVGMLYQVEDALAAFARAKSLMDTSTKMAYSFPL